MITEHVERRDSTGLFFVLFRINIINLYKTFYMEGFHGRRKEKNI